MSRLLLLRIMLHAWIARRVPVRFATAVDDMAFDLMQQARNVKPMPRKHASWGPWIGDIICEDIDCRAETRVVTLEPLDLGADLVCGTCNQETARV